ncbi:hypothetical protein LXL04_027931 [Taraxacum kok-saghyz]
MFVEFHSPMFLSQDKFCEEFGELKISIDMHSNKLPPSAYIRVREVTVEKSIIGEVTTDNSIMLTRVGDDATKLGLGFMFSAFTLCDYHDYQSVTSTWEYTNNTI